MAETIDDTVLRLEAFIKEMNPDADTSPGSVLSELLIKLAATAQNPIKNDIDELSQSSHIVEALESETETYSEVIDKIASNYNTYRNQGAKSYGKLKVIVDVRRNYFIPQGQSFQQATLKLEYVTTAAYRVVTTTPADETEIQLIQSGERFYFILPVVAVDVGSEYQVSDKAQFELTESGSISDFVSAEAYGAFVSGLPKESDKTLISRFEEGLANKTLLTRKSMLFRLRELYAAIQDISVIGANDAEMTRSKQNVFGLSTLGAVDVYIRSSLGPETVQLTKTATKQEDGNWTFDVEKDDVPGFYRISSIIPADTIQDGTLLNTQTFSYDISDTTTNLINDEVEARFTKYQTCAVEFEYDSTDAVAATKDFLVTFSYQPYIKEIQDLFLSANERILCADYLVKSSVPCYVTIDITLYKRNSNEIPVDLIKKDIFNYINTLPFGEPILASKLIDICHNYEDVRYVELPIIINGDIYTQKNNIISITGTDKLEIPSEIDEGVSPKTTTFFVDYYQSSSPTNPAELSESISIEVI